MPCPSIDPVVHIADLGTRARRAARLLATADTTRRNRALSAAAAALRADRDATVAANAQDVAALGDTRPDSFVDRLRLTPERVEAMAAALDAIATLPDPVGRTLATFDRPNGLRIERVAVPIGVIGMVYESRPNVGADAGALCLKSGNAVILRGGSESRRSTARIVAAMRAGLAWRACRRTRCRPSPLRRAKPLPPCSRRTVSWTSSSRAAGAAS